MRYVNIRRKLGIASLQELIPHYRDHLTEHEERTDSNRIQRKIMAYSPRGQRDLGWPGKH